MASDGPNDESKQYYNRKLIHLQRHSVVDLIILQRDMILEDAVPFLQTDLGRRRPGLGGDELLEIADSIVGRALDADLPPEPIVSDDLDQPRRARDCRLPAFLRRRSRCTGILCGLELGRQWRLRQVHGILTGQLGF